jgi:acyl-CoA reductase-like NAD-dependent aldehyde dehydrogenase
VSDSFVIDADELFAPPGVVHDLPSPSTAEPGRLGPGSWGIAPAVNLPYTGRPDAERALATIREVADAIEAYAEEAQQLANTCQELKRDIAELFRELAEDVDESEPVPVGALGQA